MPFKSVATPEAREAARKVTQSLADDRALALAPVIAEIQASGATTPYTIAAALMQRGIPTARGRRFWGATQVRKILNRLDRLAARETREKGAETPVGSCPPAVWENAP